VLFLPLPFTPRSEFRIPHWAFPISPSVAQLPSHPALPLFSPFAVSSLPFRHSFVIRASPFVIAFQAVPLNMLTFCPFS
jgi:hypothetical protein